MRKLWIMCKALILSTSFVLIFLTPAYAADINPQVQSQLNGLVAPRLINETQKMQLPYQGEESIDPQSGSLTLRYTDISLPGKHGLDLNISTIYNSTKSETGRKYTTLQPYSQYVAYYAELGCYKYGIPVPECGTIGPYATSDQANQAAIEYRQSNGAVDYHRVSTKPINTGYYVELWYVGGYYATWVGPYDTDAEARASGEEFLKYKDIYVYYQVKSYQKQEPTNNIDPISYVRSRYDLGSGWSFGFPSVEKYTENGIEYMYFHDGNGGAYVIDLNQNGTNLKDYQSKAVRFVTDNGTFSNGTFSSSYLFESADKVKTYFGSDGRLLGIVNPLGDQIKFEHSNRTIQGRTYPLLSRITDSLGRKVDFLYEDSADGNYSYITLTVTDPTNVNNTVSYKYSKIFDNVAGVKQPKLWKKTLASGTSDEINLSFDYDLKPVTFNYSEKRLDNQTTLTGLPASTIYMHALKKVVSPLSSKYYTYENVTRNFGSQGSIAPYRIKSRYDTLNKAGGAESVARNTVTYTYAGDYTGYGVAKSEDTVSSSYQYSTEAARADGKKVLSTYNGLGQLISMKTTAANNEKQLTTNQTFDANYKYLSTKTELKDENAAGASNTLYTARQYYDWGGLKQETRPLTASDFNDSTIQSKNTISYEYEPDYRRVTSVKSYQDNNTLLTQSYTYDNKGRILTYTNPNNETTTHSYATTPEGEVETVTTPLEGGKTAKTEIIKGLGSQQAYPTEVRSYYTDSNSVQQVSKSYSTYDLLRGQVVTQKDNNGNTTTFAYDMLGRMKKVTQPTTTPVTSPSSPGGSYTAENNYEYSFASDDGTFESSNAGLLNYKIYNKTLVKKNDGTSKTYNEQTTRYDGDGNLLTQSFYDSDRVQQVIQSQRHYDAYGRVNYAIDAEGNTASINYDAWDRPFEALDAYGNLYRSDSDLIQRKQTSYFVASGNIATFRTSPQDSLKQNVLESTMDVWGRTTNRTAYPNWPNKTSDVISEAYTYDLANNTKIYTDPRGKTTNYTYDKLNRLYQVKDALQQVTEYGYSANGKLSSVKQQDGSQNWTTVKSYNEVGSLTSKIEPGSSSESFAYNSLGQLTSHTDLNQTLFGYQYDEIGRLTKTTGGQTSFLSTFTSSPFGPDKVEEYTGTNLIRSAGITYNATGTLKDKSVSNEGYVNKVEYGYDKLNRLTSQKNPYAFITQYVYNKTRLDKVQTTGNMTFNVNDPSQYAQYTYNPNGTLNTITYPKLDNGAIIQTSYIYDDVNRVLSVTNKKDAQLLSTFGYEYDANGNILSVTDSTGKTTYVYDDLNRLKEVNKPNGAVKSYSYDVRGNRQTMQDDSLAMDLTETNYSYNLWNQLTSVTKGTATTNFQYDADGGLRIKKSGQDSIRYTYNNAGKVIAESDENNAVKTNYVWGPDRLLVKQDVSSTTPKAYLYLYNGHGDVIQMVDKTTGEVKNRYQYDEWGNVVSQTGNISNTFMYSGEQYDTETGLYYLRARYYDPTIGRFINKDSYEGQIDNPLSLNRYTYVHSNPLIYSDPTGLWCQATVDGVSYSHPGGCNDGAGGERTSGAGYTRDEVHNGWYYYDDDGQLQQYFNPGAPHITDPTGISEGLIGCLTDTQCGGFIGGAAITEGKVVVDLGKEAVKAVVTGAKNVWEWGKSLFKGKPDKPIGKPFDPEGPALQEGVDPLTLIPDRDLSILSRQRMKDAVHYARDHPITVDRNGKVINGHHRLKDAIENRRAIDVQIGN